ncbi:GNAT family N-acetyltransferase [Flavobacterium sp. NRK1]|uniref:GNAT family N-acetyltransferase n=1 Tax=Flavobacterium sp. NRK1 TaxID=2954929 RepID=UPI002093421E|nr:GNAT family N-acetyltransferase [Flavobacterium sp. NRK1]MCO6147134.1 GNAT family N-acetyltransferase [Flavobacterium sp. NRK1]
MIFQEITLRQAVQADLSEMKQLYRETILTVCVNEYDDEQRNMWAASAEKTDRWIDLVNDQLVLLAIKNNVIVGFASLRDGDYLDFMYVHKNYQRQGIAQLLLNAIEDEAKKLNTKIITSDISKTARPFFEKKGYKVIKEQENIRGNVMLVNYKMMKEL